MNDGVNCSNVNAEALSGDTSNDAMPVIADFIGPIWYAAPFLLHHETVHDVNSESN